VVKVVEGIDEAAAQRGTGLMTTALLQGMQDSARGEAISRREPDGVASGGKGLLVGDAMLPIDLLPVGITPIPVAMESGLAHGPYGRQLEDESLGLTYLTPEVRVESSDPAGAIPHAVGTTAPETTAPAAEVLPPSAPAEGATSDTVPSLVALEVPQPEVPQVVKDWDAAVDMESRYESDLTGGPTDPRSATTGTAGQAQADAGQDGGRRESSAGRGIEAARRIAASAADAGAAPEGETRVESVDPAISALGSWSPAVGVTQESTAAAGPDPARPLAEQMERALSRAIEQPGQSLRLFLEPEGLGMMQLRVELTDAGVRVSFAVEYADTANLVEATWPQLSAAFEQRGLTVDQVLVDLLGDNRWADGPAFGQSTADHSRAPAAPRRAADRAEGRGELAPAALQEVTTRIDYRV
jgi:hypothetical protein